MTRVAAVTLAFAFALVALPSGARQEPSKPAGQPVPIITVDVKPSDCSARPGCLDPSFGEAGRVLANVAGTADASGTLQIAQAAVVQPDGKIVVAGDLVRLGRNLADSELSWAVARFESDG